MTPGAGDPRPLADRLRAREPLTALLAKMPCAGQIESGAHAGFDLLILDTEHGPSGSFELEHHLRAAQAVGLPALVRVPSADPATILAALDAGAAGVVVPHVLDAAGAEGVVAAAHYPPRGTRGFATSTRAGGYGAVGLEEHLRRSAEQTCVVVQIEDAEAVPRSREILAVPGVSGVLIGDADLSLSLGRPGRPLHPEVEAAVDTILAATAEAGVAAMTVAGSGEQARAWRARGTAVVAFVSTGLIHAAFSAAVRGARPADESVAGREPLVLLPGMLCDAELWASTATALARAAAPRIGRIDLDDSVAAMGASVLAAAPERFALAGHSLGGIVALELVRQAPERVTRLALISTSARPGSEAQLATWRRLEERTEAGAFAQVARTVARANLTPSHGEDPALVERSERMALRCGADALLRQLAAQRTRPDARPFLGRIGVPVLVLSGAEDGHSPPALQVEIADAIPGARHEILIGAGHMVPLEDPDGVARHLAQWLSR